MVCLIICNVFSYCSVSLAVLSPALQAKVLHYFNEKMPIVVGDNALINVYIQPLSHALAAFQKSLV